MLICIDEMDPERSLRLKAGASKRKVALRLLTTIVIYIEPLKKKIVNVAPRIHTKVEVS
jgi:hypothetical protein